MLGRRGRTTADARARAPEFHQGPPSRFSGRRPGRSAISPAAATVPRREAAVWMKASNRPFARNASESAALTHAPMDPDQGRDPSLPHEPPRRAR